VKQGPLRHLAERLADLERRGLLRERPPPIDDSAAGIHLCSNDYLGYRSTARLDRYVREALTEGHAVGAGASRLVSGEHRAHRALEKALAAWLGCEETLIFTSGYATNVGVIAALAEEGDLIVSDALNHASIIDGCRLSKASVLVVPHNEIGEIDRVLRASRARRRWVVTESYFSMEGDIPDLKGLRAICDEHDAALVIDEAHAIGVFGPMGRGLAAETEVVPDVLVGTLGKALGAQGAFVAGSRDLCRWLWNRARSFVFSTGLSPMLSAIARGAVTEAQSDDAGRERIKVAGARLRGGLQEQGIVVTSGRGPVLPIILGSEERALAWSAALGQLGVTVQPIRPPTVPPGTSRLRVTVRADLSDSALSTAIAAFGRVAREVGR
jgi:8-amino-7-oxononanoate synthase